MILNITSKNLVRIDVIDSTLICHDADGGVKTHSLEGIILLDCSNNQLETLPIFPEGLRLLTCSYNHLRLLSKLPKTLARLNCYNNRLQSLPTLPKTLKMLTCSNNRLQTLPTLPKGLEMLSCSDNCLQTLPNLPNRLLEINCSHNPLVFIFPLVKRPKYYTVPDNLELLHSSENYSNYSKKYQTFVYLITYLALHSISPVLLSNKLFWFPGSF